MDLVPVALEGQIQANRILVAAGKAGSCLGKDGHRVWHDGLSGVLRLEPVSEDLGSFGLVCQF